MVDDDEDDAIDPALAELRAAHRQFLDLVQELRPALHRYCARMTGSVIEGEDVVQDALARAYFELSQLRERPALKTWLFRIAHHRAIDHLRRRERRAGDRPLDEEALPADAMAADAALEGVEAVDAAAARFLALSPAQRGCVILKDVLGDSLEEIASVLDMTIPAVKAALHRGRARLRELADEEPVAPGRPFHPAVVRYAQLFNARDWDGVRAMLAQDVKLELVAREQRVGLKQVGKYYINYGRVHDWWVSPAWLEGREVLVVRSHPADPLPRYAIELRVADGRIASIRDFRYARYALAEATFFEPKDEPG